MLDILTDKTVMLALSVLTVLFLLHAWRSEKRIAALKSENGNLLRSIDAIMRAPRREGGKETAMEDDLNRGTGELAVSAARTSPVPQDDGASPQDAQASPPAQPTATVPSPEAEERQSDPEQDTIATALSGMIRDDRLEICLQPIVSVSLGQSVGFDVLTRLDLPQRGEIHLRRLPGGSRLDTVDFDMSMFLVAVDTARRRLGSVSERMRLHLSISEATLRDGEAISDICSLVGLHPGIARSMVLSLPPEAARQAVLTRAARTLHDAGLALALESEGHPPENDKGLPPLDYLKLEADVLMAIADTIQDDAADDLPSRLWPRGCPPMVAAGVDSEEVAMRLIDLGIDLMVGDWFSPPRRMERADPLSPSRPGNGELCSE